MDATEDPFSNPEKLPEFVSISEINEGLVPKFDEFRSTTNTIQSERLSEKSEGIQIDPADMIWEVSFGIGDRGDSLGKRVFARWLLGLDRPVNETPLRQMARASAVESNLGLRGNVQEVTIRFLLALKAYSDRTEALRYLIDNLPPTVRRLVREGADREGIVDMFLQLIIQIRTRTTTELLDLLIVLFHHLHPKLPFDAGFLASWAALGDVAGGREEGRDQRLAVFFYDSMLRFLAKTQGSEIRDAPPLPESERLFGVVSAATNNLCGALDEFSRTGKAARVEEVMNRIHSLSCVASTLKESIHGESGSTEAMWNALAPDSIEGKEAPYEGFNRTHATFLAATMHIPSAWRHSARSIGPKVGEGQMHFRLTVIEAIGAPCRIMLERTEDEVAQTWFNASVSLLAVMRSAEFALKQTAIADARLVLCAAGAAVAFRKVLDQETLHEALYARHGLSCAVNFFGALSDRSAIFKQDSKAHLAVLEMAGLLNKDVLPGGDMFPVDFHRLGESFKQLRVDPRSLEEHMVPLEDYWRHFSERLERVLNFAGLSYGNVVAESIKLLGSINWPSNDEAALLAARLVKEVLAKFDIERQSSIGSEDSGSVQPFAEASGWLSRLIEENVVALDNFSRFLIETMEGIKPYSLVSAGVMNGSEFEDYSRWIEGFSNQRIEDFVGGMRWDFAR